MRVRKGIPQQHSQSGRIMTRITQSHGTNMNGVKTQKILGEPEDYQGQQEQYGSDNEQEDDG
eukprot:12897275-Prorocentrum_lima.AAC.1